MSKWVPTKLHRTMVELIPNRLIMGPPLGKTRSYTINVMLESFGVNCFVNLMPMRGKSRWYICNGNLVESLSKHATRPCDEIPCVSKPMSDEKPMKDKELFAFVTKLAGLLRNDADLVMYIHDCNGTYVAASVALPLLYFIKRDKTFDPVQEMRRRGKHHLVSNRNKAFVDQIKRICDMDDKSIHPYMSNNKRKASLL